MSTYLDAITALGSGSLHPGGFSHTLDELRKHTISPEHVVLDIGCGTGRTACQIAKTYGAHVFALDKSEKMLEKARSRAGKEGVEVNFVLGDALDMPFREKVADFIFIESVLVFLPVQDVLKECFRVLKKNGTLIDVEILAENSLPAAAKDQIKTLCGISQIPTLEEWLEHFRKTGFKKGVVRHKKLPGMLEGLKEMFYLDPYQDVSKELTSSLAMIKTLLKYKRLIGKHQKRLGYATFVFQKD